MNGGQAVPHSTVITNPYLGQGYKPHASGLYVPDEHSRTREVWTRDEWRILERAMKLLQSRNVDVFFGCPEPGCKKAPIERVRRNDGGVTLRCAHKDREFQARG